MTGVALGFNANTIEATSRRVGAPIDNLSGLRLCGDIGGKWSEGLRWGERVEAFYAIVFSRYTLPANAEPSIFGAGLHGLNHQKREAVGRIGTSDPFRPVFKAVAV